MTTDNAQVRGGVGRWNRAARHDDQRVVASVNRDRDFTVFRPDEREIVILNVVERGIDRRVRRSDKIEVCAVVFVREVVRAGAYQRVLNRTDRADRNIDASFAVHRILRYERIENINGTAATPQTGVTARRVIIRDRAVYERKLVRACVPENRVRRRRDAGAVDAFVAVNDAVVQPRRTVDMIHARAVVGDAARYAKTDHDDFRSDRVRLTVQRQDVELVASFERNCALNVRCVDRYALRYLERFRERNYAVGKFGRERNRASDRSRYAVDKGHRPCVVDRFAQRDLIIERINDVFQGRYDDARRLVLDLELERADVDRAADQTRIACEVRAQDGRVRRRL